MKDFRLDVTAQKVGTGLKVVVDGLPLDLLARSVVDDVELFTQANQTGALAHDVVGQTVNCSYAEAAGKQSTALDDAADAVSEILCRSVRKCDDQDFPIIYRA